MIKKLGVFMSACLWTIFLCSCSPSPMILDSASQTPTQSAHISFPIKTPSPFVYQTGWQETGLTPTLPPATRPAEDRVSGTYRLVREDGSHCFLRAILNLPIDRIPKISIELSCAIMPGPNFGYLIDTLVFDYQYAVFAPNNECRIVFEFLEHEIIVKQIGLDFMCGFGGHVYADGIYYLTDDTPPVLGCMRADDPCGLSRTP